MSSTQVSSSSTIGYGFEYFISLIIVIVVCNSLVKSSPQMNTFIVVLVGLVIGFISMKLLQFLLPNISSTLTNIYLYYTYQIMNNFNSTGYVHVWPTILAVLVLFVILLYNRQLG